VAVWVPQAVMVNLVMPWLGPERGVHELEDFV